MSDYCHRKVIRMKISEEEACKIFGVDNGWGISDLLEKTEFEIAPTSDFFIDYVLFSRNDAEGDWGRTRRLGNAEYVKYGSKFRKLLKRRIIMPNELRLVEYCWHDCSEAPDYFDESTDYDDFYDEGLKMADEERGIIKDRLEAELANVHPVKRGEWVNGKCTICEKSLEDLFTGDFYYDDNEINFCPNCGSDMRGDEK